MIDTIPPAYVHELTAQCAPGVAPSTMAALVAVESGGRTLAINVNGKQRLARHPANLAEASAWATWLISNGYSVDLGPTQVNARHLARFGLNTTSVFDPCQNFHAGGVILSECYARAAAKYGAGQGALRAAISCYNTGNDTAGFRNGYVNKVAVAAGVAPPLSPRSQPHRRP